MVFCNKQVEEILQSETFVTILILIDGFLQYKIPYRYFNGENSHNPYFNRWFSAIENIELFKKALNRSQSLF